MKAGDFDLQAADTGAFVFDKTPTFESIQLVAR